MSLGALHRELGGVQIIAFTATADAATRADIVGRLFGQEPKMLRPRLRPANLRLAMSARAGSRQILQLVDAHRGDSGIIYCSSRRRTEEIADTLRQEGVKALAYHAGMEASERSRNQDVFLQEDGVVMVATIAFGMGIDKPTCVSSATPTCRATSRATIRRSAAPGATALPANTLTLYSVGDIALRRRQIEESTSSDEQKRIDRMRLNALVSLCGVAALPASDPARLFRRRPPRRAAIATCARAASR